MVCQTLCERLALSSAANPVVTHAVDLKGLRMGLVSVAVLAIEGEESPSVSWNYALSNDGENWLGPAQITYSVVGVGYGVGAPYSGLSASKLQVTISLGAGASSAIVSVKVSLSNG